MSGGPVSVTFPNQFPLGNPENVPGILEIHFDDLLVESTQRKSFGKSKRDGRRSFVYRAEWNLLLNNLCIAYTEYEVLYMRFNMCD